MKHSFICLILLAGLAGCSGEPKETLKATGEEATTESITLVEVPKKADSLGIDVQEKAKEIDSLLEGI